MYNMLYKFDNDPTIFSDSYEVMMGEKGKRDKAKKETQKKPKLTIKEKRKRKREKGK
jgi:hypothetical protein